jgi:uncharacterized protein (TIGR03000 family)
LIAAAVCLVGAGDALPWGRGGGGGGFRAGGFGGAHYAGYVGARFGEVGGARFGEVGGARYGEVGGARYGEVGGARVGEVGGARYGEVGGYRGGVAAGHASLATDFGFGHVAGYEGARGFVGAGHYTTAYSAGALAARGVAVRGGFYHYGAFNTAWWGAHAAAWRPLRWDVARAWGWAAWPALTGWLGWSAAPIAFDYGSNIVYQGDQVYIDDQPGPTAGEYYQQAADLALSAPAAPPADAKGDAWQPLGVFSLVQGEQSDTSAVFQLAIDKSGIIRGNYYNVLTDTALPVRGSVDKKTQRASWVVGDQKTTIYDTGLANLTKDESPLLIHFGKERTQQWLLVRIKESDAKAPDASSGAKTPPPATGDDSAKITVVVPADAEVYFDGNDTTQTGTERVFVTPPLVKGTTYSYSIRAVWTEDGSPVEKTRKVSFRAGAQPRVDFTSPLP